MQQRGERSAVPPALVGAEGAGVIDDDAAHLEDGGGDELAVAGEGAGATVVESQPDLLHEVAGTQAELRRLGGEASAGEGTELVLQVRHALGDGRGGAAAGRELIAGLPGD